MTTEITSLTQKEVNDIIRGLAFALADITSEIILRKQDFEDNPYDFILERGSETYAKYMLSYILATLEYEKDDDAVKDMIEGMLKSALIKNDEVVITNDTRFIGFVIDMATFLKPENQYISESEYLEYLKG